MAQVTTTNSMMAYLDSAPDKNREPAAHAGDKPQALSTCRRVSIEEKRECEQMLKTAWLFEMPCHGTATT